MNKAVRDYLRETGRKGGKSRSKKKMTAISKNLERARAARWPRRGGRS